MVLDRLDGAQAQKMLSDVTVVFALAPAIAPILGGWLQVWFGWRAVFVFLALAGLLLGLVCRRACRQQNGRRFITAASLPITGWRCDTRAACSWPATCWWLRRWHPWWATVRLGWRCLRRHVRRAAWPACWS